MSSKKITEPKRASTRVRTISKSMKYVDEDTRREFNERHLNQLENDNYHEDQPLLSHDDDMYDNNSEVRRISRFN